MKRAGLLVLLVACHDEDAWRKIHPERTYAEPAKVEPVAPSPPPAPTIAERPEPEPARPAPPPPVAPPVAAVDAKGVLPCFDAPLRYAVPENIDAIVPGDFDGDGKLDLLVAESQLEYTTLVLYRGQGNGEVKRDAEGVKANGMAYAISAGDIDRDGDLDLAVNDPTEGKRVELFANDGHGSFEPKAPLPMQRKSYGATLVDLDGDKKLDLVVETFTHVYSFKGDGAWGFKGRAPIKTGQAPDGPAIADFDGDGSVDLAYGGNDVSTFFTLRNKRGTLALGPEETACGSPAYTSSGDVDDDGDVDVLYNCIDQVEIRRNDGKGKFSVASVPYGSGGAPVIVGDFTGDKRADLVVSPHTSTGTIGLSNHVVLLAGDGKGDWPLLAAVEVGQVSDIAAADLSGDGRPDLVVGTWSGMAAELSVFVAGTCPPR